ncbi:MAG: lytic transglycosylase domain-containing protein [Gemmatimonadaceae bacterium]
MFRNTITRALGRRKIEAAMMLGVAAISSVGLARNDVAVAEAAVAPAPTSAPVRYLVEAASNAASKPTSAAPARTTMGLPNLDHPRVESWVKRFTTDQRGSFATYLRRMTRYEDMISGKLADRDMPQGLIFLAMIESGFNPTAKSPVKASGLWQFMSATGKEYGLKVTRKVDERNNPARSTDAALRYLSHLHNRFGSWYLAAAAYNTGQGRVARIMKQETGKTRGTDADYYRISHRLPQETRDYVPKMIAAARIGADPVKYGFRAN